MNLCDGCGIEMPLKPGPVPKRCVACRSRQQEGTCRDCGAPVRRKHAKATGPLPQRCEPCIRKRRMVQIRSYEKKRWQERPELLVKERIRRTEQMRRWRAANPEKRRETDREAKRRKAADPITGEVVRRRQRAANLKRFYGLTVERYEELLAEQGGVCAICKEPPKVGKRLHIDHDHGCCNSKKTCGKCIRGLLCDFCNNGLGRFRDRPDLLLAAAAFLSR